MTCLIGSFLGYDSDFPCILFCVTKGFRALVCKYVYMWRERKGVELGSNKWILNRRE